MSHFTVLVIGDDVEGQLAPYDENLTVERYKDFWDTEHINRIEQSLSEDDPGLPLAVGMNSMEAIAAAYNARYGDDEDRVFVDPQAGIYSWTTYNPKSKWDWYVVGGRWRGFFKVKANGKGVLGDPGAFGNPPVNDGGADQLLKGVVDAEAMRSEAGEAAAKAWDLARRAFAKTPEATPWTEFVARVRLATDGQGEPYTIEQARKDYAAQPRVQKVKTRDEKYRRRASALRESNPAEAERLYNLVLLGWSDGVEQFQIPREEYIQRARDSAISPYAYVIEGQWNAPGNMGWFGASDDTESDRLRFDREFNAIFDALPDDTLLTLVDCHI